MPDSLLGPEDTAVEKANQGSIGITFYCLYAWKKSLRIFNGYPEDCDNDGFLFFYILLIENFLFSKISWFRRIFIAVAVCSQYIYCYMKRTDYRRMC